MDNLTKQLLGRYAPNRLTIQTSLDPALVSQVREVDVKSIVIRNLQMELADKLVSDYNRTLVQEKSPFFSGDLYRMELYSFSRMQLERLINDCFNAGLEAAKDDAS